MAALLELAQERMKPETPNVDETKTNVENISSPVKSNQEYQSLKDIWRKMGTADSHSTPTNNRKTRKSAKKSTRSSSGKKRVNGKLLRSEKEKETQQSRISLGKFRRTKSSTLVELAKENTPPFLLKKEFDSAPNSPSSSDQSPPSSPLSRMSETPITNYFRYMGIRHGSAHSPTKSEKHCDSAVMKSIVDDDDDAMVTSAEVTPYNYNRAILKSTNSSKFTPYNNNGIVVLSDDTDDCKNKIIVITDDEDDMTINSPLPNSFQQVKRKTMRDSMNIRTTRHLALSSTRKHVTPPNKTEGIAGYFNIEKGKHRRSSKLITEDTLDDASPATLRILAAMRHIDKGDEISFSQYTMENVSISIHLLVI
ncbi:208_t:CDS:2 [Acaulospora morrowiae]|uniref:208_t:CDS:1 n=1 Tax=Acaulospora morrowiae TaxID=94023 RepID=A0A9N9DV78_9GLOM|nr:208_t:CDS:2 [Acaulospora morrowiae]